MPIKPFSRSHRPNDPGFSVDVPIQWRSLSSLSELWFYALAITEMGKPIAFTLHMTTKTKQMMARSSLSPQQFIAKRFRDQLPGTPFFFVLETARAGEVHVHGVVALQGDDQLKLERQLYKIAGDRRKLRPGVEQNFYHQRALRLEQCDLNRNYGGRNGIFGWATYCSKQIGKFSSPQIARSLDVSKLARQIHQEVVGPFTPQVSLSSAA